MLKMTHQEKNIIIFGFVNTYIKGSNLPSPIKYNLILEDSLSKYSIMFVYWSSDMDMMSFIWEWYSWPASDWVSWATWADGDKKWPIQY